MKSFDEIRNSKNITVKGFAEHFVAGDFEVGEKKAAFVCTGGHLSIYANTDLNEEDIRTIKELFFNQTTSLMIYQKLGIGAREYVFWGGNA